MTTTLTRPVGRRVRTLGGTPLVVTLTPEGIQLRESRRRTKYLLPYGVAFVEAARLYVADQKRRAAADRPMRSKHTRARTARRSES